MNNALYDYIITINLQSGGNVAMNSLFLNRGYPSLMFYLNNGKVTVNTASTNSNSALLNLVYNQTLIRSIFNTNAAFTTSLNNNIINTYAYNTIDNTQGKTLSFRLLEIIAMKIFGNAKAQAAIYNQTDFSSTSLSTTITSNMALLLTNNIWKNYVEYTWANLNRTSGATSAGNLNFNNTSWDFPIYFKSNLFSSTSLINNGPNVGGNILQNGSMNIPIILRFTSLY